MRSRNSLKFKVQLEKDLRYQLTEYWLLTSCRLAMGSFYCLSRIAYFAHMPLLQKTSQLQLANLLVSATTLLTALIIWWNLNNQQLKFLHAWNQVKDRLNEIGIYLIISLLHSARSKLAGFVKWYAMVSSITMVSWTEFWKMPSVTGWRFSIT